MLVPTFATQNLPAVVEPKNATYWLLSSGSDLPQTTSIIQALRQKHQNGIGFKVMTFGGLECACGRSTCMPRPYAVASVVVIDFTSLLQSCWCRCWFRGAVGSERINAPAGHTDIRLIPKILHYLSLLEYRCSRGTTGLQTCTSSVVHPQEIW